MSALPEHTPAAPAARPAGPRPGLRERKKARTRAAIREHAFRLFREQGYDATTVEQIADAAEVSPSTFFRYFPTKEDVVLQDDLDLLWMEAIREQPPEVGPIAALRAGVHSAFARMGEAEWAQLRETTELALAVPAVRGRMLEEMARTTQALAEAVAERTGRDPGDFAVRTLAGAIIGIAMAAWFEVADDLMDYMDQGRLATFADKFERGLALLEAGLPL
ncbi:MAG TPA: TetR family transcriptional regulator [Streptosporangiaceae bacterium]|nr:TetR family transcriptional regulator [Streptosporangiaceae bacterium]